MYFRKPRHKFHKPETVVNKTSAWEPVTNSKLYGKKQEEKQVAAAQQTKC